MVARDYDQGRFLMPIELDKHDTLVIKAITIFLIVSHNFFRHVAPLTGENEFTFSQEHFHQTLYSLISDPINFFNPLVSFFGHYGVHIFLFLSGYGLTKKCLSLFKDRENIELASLYRVSFGQIFKLMKLTLIGVMVLAIYNFILWGRVPDVEWIKSYLTFLSFSENLIPGKMYSFVSVWWFLALLVQFYLLFPLIFSALKRFPQLTLGLSFLALACAVILYQPLLEQNVFVFATPLGQMPVFVLGSFWAMGRLLDRRWLGCLVAVLPLSLMFEAFFPLSFVAMTVCSIYLYQKMSGALKTCTALQWIGQLSMFIYIVHGDFRWRLLEVVEANPTLLMSYVVFIGYLLEVFLVAWVCHWLVKNYNLFWMKKPLFSLA